jgi:predicted RNA-binding protein Jag
MSCLYRRRETEFTTSDVRNGQSNFHITSKKNSDFLHPEKSRERKAETACQPEVPKEKVQRIEQIVTQAITWLIYITSVIKMFSLLQSLQTGSGAYPDSYPKGTGGCGGVKLTTV